MQYLTIWDLLLTPVFLLILIAFAKSHRNKYFSIRNPLRRYYLPGLYLKFFGVIFIALLYQFYYNGGDTYNYFTHSRIINSALSDSFTTWLKLIFRVSIDNNPELYPYVSQLKWYNDPPSYTVGVIGALLGLLSGTTYIPIALLFAFISYTGIWAGYRTFVNLYPQLHKPLAIAFLFIPSTFVWGSAMFKDTICMFGLGWLTYTTFRIFIYKDFSTKNILILIISFYLIAIIKVYILIAFLPALSLWVFMTYAKKIKLATVRWTINILFIGLTSIGFLFLSQRFASELNKYSLENIAITANVTRDYISYVSETQDGSGYDLGDFEPTITGMISKFPAAVVVTLYRPFPWEIKKPIMVLSALESLFFVFLTILVLYKRGIMNTLKNIIKDPNLSFFALFSIIFAFAVGISTYNFGTLSRYKIPCIPFFAALLLILYYQYKPSNTKISNKTKRKNSLHSIS